MKNQHFSRRKFLGTSTLALAGIAVASKSSFGAPAYIKNLGKPNSLFNGVQIGCNTYSFRSLPLHADTVLQYCIDSNLSAIEMKGDEAEDFGGAPKPPARPQMAAPAPGQPRPAPNPEYLAAIEEYNVKIAEWRANVPMSKFEQIRKMYNDAGVSIYAYKPNALGPNNTDAEIDYTFRAARALGADHVTLEFPTSSVHTKKLGDFGARYKIHVGYHGHLQQTYDMWDASIIQSAYNASNFDMGHYVAAGFDPIDYIIGRHSHIVSMHVKDRKSKANGGANLPWGEGDTPIIEALQLMSKNQYHFPASIELEYQIPAGSDAVKEVAKCVEYARKALGA